MVGQIPPFSAETRRVLAYWDEKRGAKPLPARADLDPLVDLPDLAPWLGLVEPVGTRLRYRLLGGAHEEIFGPRTGAYLDEVREPPYLDFLRAAYARCMRDAVPVYCENGFRYGGGRLGRSARIILPLASDGATVDMFFGIQLSHGEEARPLEPAWLRAPEFREDLFGELYRRGPDGAWRAHSWRALA